MRNLHKLLILTGIFLILFIWISIRLAIAEDWLTMWLFVGLGYINNHLTKLAIRLRKEKL